MQPLSRCDIGVIELCQRLCFRSESRNDMRLSGKFWTKHLYRDLPLGHEVDSLVDGSHPALAEFFYNLVIRYYVVNHVASS